MDRLRKIYIASDMHFGMPNHEASLEREKLFVAWLDSIQKDAEELWLLGDIFDFWFEWKHAVPKGYIRLFGKLAEMADAGVEIHVFVGNHDLWYGDYLTEQIGAKIYRKPQVRSWFGKQYYLAHGDGLGPKDHGYKLLKRILTFPFFKWSFARLHPNLSIAIANYVSGKSRLANPKKVSNYDAESEFLFAHARDMIVQNPDLDYFVFGHRHHFIEEKIASDKQLFYLGDWITWNSWLEIGPEGPELKRIS